MNFKVWIPLLAASLIGPMASATEVVTLISKAESDVFYKDAHGEVRQAESTTFAKTPGQPDTRDCKALVDSVFEDLKSQADKRCVGGKNEALYLISNPGHVRRASEWGDFESQIDVVTAESIFNCSSYMKQEKNEGVTRTLVSKGAFRCKQGLKNSTTADTGSTGSSNTGS